MRSLILRALRLSEEPAMLSAPVERFTASRRLLTWRRIRWGLHQVGAGLGLVVSLVLLRRFEETVVASAEQAVREHMAGIDRLLSLFDMSMVQALTAVEAVAVIIFPVQLVVSGILLRLDWELRSYQVSDTAISIREGLYRQREQTMTIANIQNMVIRQGPIQRLLGISDLEISTAGGGSAAQENDGGDYSKGLHIGRIAGIEEAPALRDRLRSALASQRDPGLGDPDDVDDPRAHGTVVEPPRLASALDQLLAEVQALRRARG